MKKLFETNVWGVVTLTQLAAPLLITSANGRVVKCSSGVGSFGFFTSNDPIAAIKPIAYCLSKTTLNGVMALFAAAPKKDGVKVNAANRGLAKSALSGFMGERGPDQGAKVIVDLANLADDGPIGGFFDSDGPIPW